VLRLCFCVSGFVPFYCLFVYTFPFKSIAGVPSRWELAGHSIAEHHSCAFVNSREFLQGGSGSTNQFEANPKTNQTSQVLRFQFSIRMLEAITWNLTILFKLSGVLWTIGVKTSWYPWPCQSPLLLPSEVGVVTVTLYSKVS